MDDHVFQTLCGVPTTCSRLCVGSGGQKQPQQEPQPAPTTRELLVFAAFASNVGQNVWFWLGSVRVRPHVTCPCRSWPRSVHCPFRSPLGRVLSIALDQHSVCCGTVLFLNRCLMLDVMVVKDFAHHVWNDCMILPIQLACSEMYSL